MSEPKDGGLAFPVGFVEIRNDPISGNPYKFYGHQHGMSLRDYFAGCVAVGIMRTCDETPGTAVTRDDIAMEAYRMADAMLRAREGK